MTRFERYGIEEQIRCAKIAKALYGFLPVLDGVQPDLIAEAWDDFSGYMNCQILIVDSETAALFWEWLGGAV